MALFKTTITRVTGRGAHLYAGTGERLFNGLGVYNLGAGLESGCTFEYYINLVDDRDGVVRVETDDGLALIRGYVNDDNPSTFIDLFIYPDQSITLPTEKETILTKNISILYDVTGGSVIYYLQGARLTREICTYTVDEILAGGTTTTTTSTSTTSTSTSTTSTSTTSTSTSTTSTTTSTTTTTSEAPAEGVYWDDGVDYFRLQVRGGVLFLDQTITGAGDTIPDQGWNGVEDIDWGNIWEQSL